VAYNPDGFTNDVGASDTHSVNLFTASINIVKTGDEYSKNWGGQADEITYTVTINNTSSDDTPNLILQSYSDTQVTDLSIPEVAGCGELAPGGSCSFDYTYTPTVTEGEGDTLENTFNAVYSPDGFPNEITDDDGDESNTHTVTLVHPTFTVAKECSNEPVPQDGPATWTVGIENTGDIDLVMVANEDLMTGTETIPAGTSFTVGAGKSPGYTVSKPLVPDDATIANEVVITATLPSLYGLANSYEGRADDTCYVAGRVNLTKLTQGVPNDEDEIIPSPGLQNWTFKLYGPGLPTEGVTDTSPPSEVDFGDPALIPIEYDGEAIYRLCEGPINAGWTLAWYGDPNDTGIADQLIPFLPMNANAPVRDPKDEPPGYSNVFDPNYVAYPESFLNDTRCVNFVVNAGSTEVFKIDNQFPGGEPRTIGYWKNWNSCTGGGQLLSALEAGDTSEERIEAGKALLNDALQDPGITIGLLTMVAGPDVEVCDVATQQATYLLDKRLTDGSKAPGDSAYDLAAQLLAAIANVTVGAGSCAARDDAVLAAQTLLDGIGFDGTDIYLDPKTARKQKLTDERSEAIALAETLDSYNNGTLCVVATP